MVLLGVFVFRYVLLAGSLVLRRGGLHAPLYTRNKQFFDILARKPYFHSCLSCVLCNLLMTFLGADTCFVRA